MRTMFLSAVIFYQAHVMRVAEVGRIALRSEDPVEALVKCQLICWSSVATFAHFSVLYGF